MTNFKISVTSDTVCPWCYVGHRQLQAAQDIWTKRPSNSGDTFNLRYLPYQLNPHWPRGPGAGSDKIQNYLDKFGQERAEMIYDRLRKAGNPLGIKFKFGGRTGNTRDSHRLIHLAKGYGEAVEIKTVEGLFAAYLENERDITDYETLRQVAKDAGVPDEEFQKAIVESDQGGVEVDRGLNEERLKGVAGVPKYVINGRFQVNGAREPAAYLRAFEKVKAIERGEKVAEDVS